jgi:hypothetical protein
MKPRQRLASVPIRSNELKKSSRMSWDTSRESSTAFASSAMFWLSDFLTVTQIEAQIRCPDTMATQN